MVVGCCGGSRSWSRLWLVEAAIREVEASVEAALRSWSGDHAFSGRRWRPHSAGSGWRGHLRRAGFPALCGQRRRFRPLAAKVPGDRLRLGFRMPAECELSTGQEPRAGVRKPPKNEPAGQ
jgi:hypothetical protein